MTKRLLLFASSDGGLWLSVPNGTAQAHVSVASGPGFADKSQVVTFGVGHGCAGADTLSVRVQIPADVTSVRALNSDLGPAKVEKNAAGLVTAVVWSKPISEIVEGDPNYYSLALRFRVPNKPFTTVLFPRRPDLPHPGRCRDDGRVDGRPPRRGPERKTRAVPDAAAPEPAPALLIVPARVPGWNKYTEQARRSRISRPTLATRRSCGWVAPHSVRTPTPRP